jgi:putative OPT family oligopeptide transporter
MQVVGVGSAAFVMAPVLNLLLAAYGIGTPTPTHPNPLPAPQATLMAAVAGGVFRGGLPWGMVAWGAGTAVAIIAADTWLARRHASFRMPVLAVAVGIYLPLELSVAIFIGGLVAWAAGTSGARHNGLLFAAGLITGEALIGVVLAVPIVLAGDPNVLAPWGRLTSSWPGVFLLVVVLGLLYRAAGAASGGRSGIGRRANDT